MNFTTIKGWVFALSLLSLLLWPFCTSAQSSLLSRTDNQEWNDVQIAIPVTKQIDFSFVGTLRFGRDLGRAVDERIGAGFTFKANKYLNASAAYLHIGMQPISIRRIYEERVVFPITVRVPVGKFSLSDRNQFEFRRRHPGGNSTRYRNRFQVDHPVGPARWNLSIFAADEVFYDWSFDAWVRNRASAGVTKVMNKHLTIDLYYLRQNDGRSIPGDLNVLGTAFRFKL